MKIRLTLIFDFVIFISFFCFCKNSTDPKATHGNLSLINDQTHFIVGNVDTRNLHFGIKE